MQPKLSDIGLVPYVQLDGKWTVPDETLMQIAEASIQDGTFHRVFYEGHIRSRKDFVQMMKQPANVPVFLFCGSEPVGFAWLNGVTGSTAFAHFCFLSQVWGQCDDIGKLLLRYWMSLDVNGPVFDTLIGVIPTFNRHAIRFAQRAGMTLLGVIPRMSRHANGDRLDSAVLYFVR